MAEKFHDDWEVVPFNLNMDPTQDPDARALVPANTERQLEAMPLRQRSSAQSYHAQPVHRTTTTPTPHRIIIQDEDHYQGANRHQSPST